MLPAMPCCVITRSPLKPESSKSGSAGSPSLNDRSVSAILVIGEPLGRSDCSNGDEAGKRDFRGAVGVEIEADRDVAGGGDDALAHVEGERIAATGPDREPAAVEAAEVDDRRRGRRRGAAGGRRARTVDAHFEVIRIEYHARHADQVDACRVCAQRVVAGPHRRAPRFQQRQAEIEIGDRKPGRPDTGGIVVLVEEPVAVTVRVRRCRRRR
jgi:hypothetical protein